MIEIWERQSVRGTLHPIMQKVQGRIARLYIGKGSRLMISSRSDGEHSPGSFHYLRPCQAEDYLDPQDTPSGKLVSLYEIRQELDKLATQLGINRKTLQIAEYSWGYHVEYDNA